MSLEFWFQVDLAMPTEMTREIQQDLSVAIEPRWRVTDVSMAKLEPGMFRLRLELAADTPDEPSLKELREFRDLIVSLVAFSAMVPVHLRSKGIFDFPVGERRRKHVSLGPMNIEYPRTPLSSIEPVIRGLALPAKYVSALHFLWQALNSEHPLYRFMNLAVAVELIANRDSPAERSRHPRCGRPACGFELAECPQCQASWKVPSTLREKAAFFLEDGMISRFNKARNQVFHGAAEGLHHDFALSLPDLNDALLVHVRNYLARHVGAAPIDRPPESLALKTLELSMTVHYSEPGASEEQEVQQS